MSRDADDLLFLSALDLARLIRGKELTAVELVDRFLSRIDALNPKLNAFITVAYEQARQMARDADARLHKGDPAPFLGVPISIKDLVDTVGIPSTHGTASWRDRVPTSEPRVITRLRDAGFVIVGKTNVPEFAVGGVWTEPLAYGACRNPWHLDYTNGGSSGGAAAALAARMCAISHGTDDAGSIRIPSGWTNVFGLKPSRGRVSSAPDPQDMYFTHGVLSNSVADAAAMLDLMSGYESGDGFWAPPPPTTFLDSVNRPRKPLTIKFTTHAADSVPVVADNVRAVEETAKLLQALGHKVEEAADWPGRGAFPDERIMSLPVIYGARYAGMIDRGFMPPAETLEPPAQLVVQLGRTGLASDYIASRDLTERDSRRVVDFFRTCDVFMTPVIASRPSLVGERFREVPTDADAPLQVIQFTGQFSASGQPAVSVPAGFDAGGLPVGVQLVGRPADEATLLSLSAEIEEARPWADRHPQLD